MGTYISVYMQGGAYLLVCQVLFLKDHVQLAHQRCLRCNRRPAETATPGERPRSTQAGLQAKQATVWAFSDAARTLCAVSSAYVARHAAVLPPHRLRQPHSEAPHSCSSNCLIGSEQAPAVKPALAVSDWGS